MERVEVFVIMGIAVTWITTLLLKLKQHDIETKLDELLKDKEDGDG